MTGLSGRKFAARVALAPGGAPYTPYEPYGPKRPFFTCLLVMNKRKGRNEAQTRAQIGDQEALTDSSDASNAHHPGWQRSCASNHTGRSANPVLSSSGVSGKHRKSELRPVISARMRLPPKPEPEQCAMFMCEMDSSLVAQTRATSVA